MASSRITQLIKLTYRCFLHNVYKTMGILYVQLMHSCHIQLQSSSVYNHIDTWYWQMLSTLVTNSLHSPLHNILFPVILAATAVAVLFMLIKADRHSGTVSSCWVANPQGLQSCSCANIVVFCNRNKHFKVLAIYLATILGHQLSFVYVNLCDSIIKSLKHRLTIFGQLLVTLWIRLVQFPLHTAVRSAMVALTT